MGNLSRLHIYRFPSECGEMREIAAQALKARLADD
jgi:hypothetical protein